MKPKFIKLTTKTGEIWINFNLVESFQTRLYGRDTPGFTNITTTQDEDGGIYQVAETPEQILAMIQGE